MKEKNFEMPTAEMIMFLAQDVITTSGESGGGSGVETPFHPWDD